MNLSAVKRKDEVIAYVKKDGNFITNFETDLEFRRKLQHIASEKGLEKALNYFVETRPELVSTSFLSTKRNLESFLNYRASNCRPKFGNFDYPPELLEWFNNEKHEKTVFLTGESGIGKTEGIITLLRD